MKKIIVSLSLVLGLTTTLLADATNNGWESSASLQSVVASKYDSFVMGATLYDKPVIQTDLFVSFRNGLYLDLWNSTPLDGYNHNYGTEQDFGVGWSGPLSTFGLKGSASDVVLNVEVMYFDEPQVGTFGAGDMLYTHVKLSKAFKWVTAFAGYENTAVSPFGSVRGLDVFSVGASKGASFFKDLVSASTSLALAYNTKAFGLDNGLFIRGNVELDWKLTKRLTVILPSLNCWSPVTVCDRRSFDAVIAAGLSLKF